MPFGYEAQDARRNAEKEKRESIRRKRKSGAQRRAGRESRKRIEKFNKFFRNVGQILLSVLAQFSLIDVGETHKRNLGGIIMEKEIYTPMERLLIEALTTKEQERKALELDLLLLEMEAKADTMDGVPMEAYLC